MEMHLKRWSIGFIHPELVLRKEFSEAGGLRETPLEVSFKS